jgi:hypothetical protein
LYSSGDIISVIKSRRTRWAGNMSRMGEVRISYRIFVGKPERKRSLGRTGRRWWDNVKLGLREIGWERVVRIHLALALHLFVNSALPHAVIAILCCPSYLTLISIH